uniref:Tetratricopeptide TPR_2 repeat protein n=1 Tax=Solibacter usitatus (strain Ellin6076) TaxID=234267 RepID=Q024L1_SOLUE
MSSLSTAELTRLERFLGAHDSRFALALVRMPQTPQREEFARRLQEFSGEQQRPFHRFDLAGLGTGEVWGKVEQGLPVGTIAILEGLDESFNHPDGQMASFLNRQRERIAELLPGPVLLVLGDRAMDRFFTDAPDLADWYAASFEFSATASAAPAQDDGSIPENSSEWIESRMSLLRAQLQADVPDRIKARILRELALLYRDSVYGVPMDPDRVRTRSASESLGAAEVMAQEAVEIQRSLALKDTSADQARELALALNVQGSLLQESGRYAEAEPLAKEALEIRKRVLGEEHPDTIRSQNNLAGLYQRMGRYAEAEPLYRNALATRERLRGAEHPDTLKVVNNLASLYAEQGQFAQAEPLYLRALHGRKKLLGEEHPETLNSLNNLAQLYERYQRYAEAEPLYLRTVAARERLLGRDHPYTLNSLNNLANLYARQQRYKEALPLYRQVLTVRERVLGPEHPSTLSSLNNLAFLYARQRRYNKAEPLYRRAISGAEKVLGHDHPETRLFRENLEALREPRPGL